MNKKIVIGCVAAVAVCALILPKVFSKKPFAEAVADPIVEVTKPETRDISLTTELVGSIEPEDVVYVYPKASGEVTEVKIKAGEIVQEGQLLCVIDTKQVESAKNSLDSAALSLSQAQDELSRQSILYSSGGISEQAYRQYQDNVKSAQIAYSNAKINYDNQVSYSQITAPISGLIEVCNIEVFDQVAQSNLLCVISGQGARNVSFSTTERIKKQLSEGDMIVVEKDGETYDGQIYEVSSMADSDTGLFKVKARLDDSVDEFALSTGSMVKLHVISDSARGVMSIPVDAVYYDGGLSYVYTYDTKTSAIHKVQVEAGLDDSDYIEVKSGLDAGTQVLVTWSSELYEGTKVRIKESGQSGEGAESAEQKNSQDAAQGNMRDAAQTEPGGDMRDAAAQAESQADMDMPQQSQS